MKRLFIVILTCFSLHSLAEEVSGLYSGLVPVADQSAESRQIGIRDALEQVLIKLTGNSNIIWASGLQSFLANPDRYVSSIGFSRLPDVGLGLESDAELGLGLAVGFARQAIDQIIRQAQLPILPSNRPRLLVWIIRDDTDKGRGFINEHSPSGIDEGSSALDRFDQAMQVRGIPYVLPAYDLKDQLSLSVNEAWSLNADLIDNASKRYETDGWLALRFYVTSSGEVRGTWLSQIGGNRKLRNFHAASGQPFMSEVVDELVDNLAQSFTYIPQVNPDDLVVQVDGVVSFEDYTAVLAQFNKLELVESLKVSAVDGPEMTLSVTVEGDVDLLQSALVRSGKFQNESLQDSLYAGKLRFNWVGK